MLWRYGYAMAGYTFRANPKISAAETLLMSGLYAYNPRLSGRVAQSVEQRIENPCVGSSILPPATK